MVCPFIRIESVAWENPAKAHNSPVVIKQDFIILLGSMVEVD